MKISIDDVVHWMVQMAACDGAISPAEELVLRQFAQQHELDEQELINWAQNESKNHKPEVRLLNTSQEKGFAFEAFVVELIVGTNCVKFLQWRSDKFVNGTFALDNLLPDLLVSHRLGMFSTEYFIECKYRSKWDDKEQIPLNHSQLQRFRNLLKENREVIIVLGVGGHPCDPEEFYVFPLRVLRNGNYLQRNKLGRRRCEKTSETLHSKISEQFSYLANLNRSKSR